MMLNCIVCRNSAQIPAKLIGKKSLKIVDKMFMSSNFTLNDHPDLAQCLHPKRY